MSRRSRPRPSPAATKAAPAGTLWLWGIHPVLAALANPARRVHRLLATADAAQAQADTLAAAARTRALPRPETADRAAIAALLPPGAVHQGLAALCEPLPPADLGDVIAAAEGRDTAVIIVLDQVTDPHNLGAVMRSAAAFGALGVVATDRHAPGETGTLAKAASGALERMPLARVVNLARALQEMKEAGFWIAGLAADAPATLAAAKLGGRAALVLGAEGEGLRRLTREQCDLLVSLPQTDAVESLNVSNAAAVALYELVRR